VKQGNRIEPLRRAGDIMRNKWLSLKNDIAARLADFKNKWVNGTDEDIFAELVFCLFTPQSKAKSCWASVNQLLDKKLIFNGTKLR